MKKYWFIIISLVYVLIVICTMIKWIDPGSIILLVASLLYGGLSILNIYVYRNIKKNKI